MQEGVIFSVIPLPAMKHFDHASSDNVFSQEPGCIPARIPVPVVFAMLDV